MSFVDNEDAKFIEKIQMEKENKVRIEKEREVEDTFLFKKELIKKRKNNQIAPVIDGRNLQQSPTSNIEMELLEDKMKEIEKGKKLFEGIKRSTNKPKKEEEIQLSLIDYSDSE